MNNIPHIIHQTWKTQHLPVHFAVLTKTWKKFHPNWEYKFWTDEMNRNFIKRNYPEFLEKYDTYPSSIQRADIIRYFILLKEGGVYVDVDFECLENISPLLSGETCVIGKEPKLHCDLFHRKLILCNAFMASTKNNHFIEYLLKKIMEFPTKLTTSIVDILESTGPFILTDSFENYIHKDKIKILESNTIYPLTMYEIRQALTNGIDDFKQQKINDAYAVHYFWGSWHE